MPSQPLLRPAASFAAGLPRTLGNKYTLVQEIGRGGMAAVHLAISGGIGAYRTCAIKTVLYRPGERDGELLTKRFLEEAAAVTKLSHDNLVYVFDAGVVERELYLAMELIAGQTLADVMAKPGRTMRPLPLDLALFITIEILHGLAHVHSHGLVHRDVSPSNVMISESGGVKLLDFGLARSADSKHYTGLALKLGKAGYAAPEQLLGGEVSARSDLFSVGVMLWEMLAGRPLVSTDGVRPRRLEFVSPSQHQPSVPKELDETLRMALADAAEDRFESAAHFADELSRFLAPADHRKVLRQFIRDTFGAELARHKTEQDALVQAAIALSASAPLSPSRVGPMASPEDYVGSVLDGRYELRRLIGKGSMGAVYEGEHRGIGRKVAIKIPFLHGSAELKQRFVREARATNKINDPHVVDITDAGETPLGDAYVVMDYLEGRDLEKWNAERKVWPPDDAVDVAVQVAQGLEAAHNAGVIHRDLKPSNIMMAETRHGPIAKVLDFGVAKLMHSDAALPMDGLTRPDTALGTPLYMAPEQMIAGRTVDGRADIYSAAAILYQMLSGKLPHEASDTAALCFEKINTPPKPLDVQGLHLPMSLGSLVMEALSPDPDLRPSSAAVWRSRLEDTRPERRRGMTTAPVELQRSDQHRRRRVAWTVAIVLQVTAVLIWIGLHKVPTPEPAGVKQESPSATGLPLPSKAADPTSGEVAPTEALPVPEAQGPAPALSPAGSRQAKRPVVASPGRPVARPQVTGQPEVQPKTGQADEVSMLEASEQALVVGDFPRATRLALDALSLHQSARAYAMLARVHMAHGEKKAAAAVVEEGVQRFPADRTLTKLAERLK